MKRLVGAFVLAVCMTVGGLKADATFPCATWVTVSTTPKQYSSCNWTYVGAWWAAVGGVVCLQFVSWRRTQWRIDSYGALYRRERTLLENEVRATGTVRVGPVVTNKTQTVPGSHTTSVISSYSRYRLGGWHCGTSNSSGSW